MTELTLDEKEMLKEDWQQLKAKSTIELTDLLKKAMLVPWRSRRGIHKPIIDKWRFGRVARVLLQEGNYKKWFNGALAAADWRFVRTSKWLMDEGISPDGIASFGDVIYRVIDGLEQRSSLKTVFDEPGDLLIEALNNDYVRYRILEKNAYFVIGEVRRAVGNGTVYEELWLRAAEEAMQFHPSSHQKSLDALVDLTQIDSETGRAILEGYSEIIGTGVLTSEYLESALRMWNGSDSNSFHNWLNEGVDKVRYLPSVGRSYFSTESFDGAMAIHRHTPGIDLEDIQAVLELYSTAIGGRRLRIRATYLKSKEDFLPTTDGEQIWLPQRITQYGSDQGNFTAYKVFVTLQAGKLEFGTFEVGQDDVKNVLGKAYVASDNEKITPLQEFYENFGSARVAQSLFEIIEGRRVLDRVKGQYAGVRDDLDYVVQKEFESREDVTDSQQLMLMEAYAQLTTTSSYSIKLPKNLEGVLNKMYDATQPALAEGSSVNNSLEATVAVYSMLSFDDSHAEGEKKDLGENKKSGEEGENQRYGEGDVEQQSGNNEDKQKSGEIDRESNKRGDVREYDNETLENAAKEPIKQHTMSEEDMGRLESFLYQGGFELKSGMDFGRSGVVRYPEWNLFSGSYMKEWTRVNDLPVIPAEAGNSDGNRITQKLMVQTFERNFDGRLSKHSREEDGDDIDIDAAIEFLVDRKSGVSRDPDFYIRQRKSGNEFAAALLIDASPSTNDYVAGRQRTIDVERHAIEILSAGLDSVNHTYGIYAFAGHLRENVGAYIVKGFDEKFDIGKLYGFEPLREERGGNGRRPSSREVLPGTYTGAAVRHITRLIGEVDHPNKILILLTDSMPSGDGNYNTASYARADVGKAFQEARSQGILPVAISIGNEPPSRLRQMYGNSFVRVKDIQQLPSVLPKVYLRLSR